MKTLAEWEQELHILIVDADPADLEKKVAEPDAAQLMMDGKARGVNHADRIAFLKANGHKVTRENMINPNLSARADS
jgi:hypothetical protein